MPSFELMVPIFRLEEWYDRALAGIDVGAPPACIGSIAVQAGSEQRHVGPVGRAPLRQHQTGKTAALHRGRTR